MIVNDKLERIWKAAVVAWSSYHPSIYM